MNYCPVNRYPVNRYPVNGSHVNGSHMSDYPVNISCVIGFPVNGLAN